MVPSHFLDLVSYHKTSGNRLTFSFTIFFSPDFTSLITLPEIQESSEPLCGLLVIMIRWGHMQKTQYLAISTKKISTNFIKSTLDLEWSVLQMIPNYLYLYSSKLFWSVVSEGRKYSKPKNTVHQFPTRSKTDFRFSLYFENIYL